MEDLGVRSCSHPFKPEPLHQADFPESLKQYVKARSTFQHLVQVQTFSMHTHIHSVKAGCQAEVCHRLWVQTNVNGSISHTSIAQCQWLVTSAGLRLLPVALLATNK